MEVSRQLGKSSQVQSHQKKVKKFNVACEMQGSTPEYEGKGPYCYRSYRKSEITMFIIIYQVIWMKTPTLWTSH